jgi:curved DNA-binding protein CbpA
MAKDYYRILQVHSTAEPEVIKAAYQRLIQKYHPDKNPKDLAEAKRRSQEINEAWVVLSNPERRAKYDREHCAGNEGEAEVQPNKAEAETRRAQEAEAARRDAEARVKQSREEVDRLRRQSEANARKAKEADEARWKAEARAKQAETAQRGWQEQQDTETLACKNAEEQRAKAKEETLKAATIQLNIENNNGPKGQGYGCLIILIIIVFIIAFSMIFSKMYIDKSDVSKNTSIVCTSQKMASTNPQKRTTHLSIPTDAQTQFDWGFAYEYGKGVSQDYAEAAKWYCMAAQQGNADAQYYLGLLYEFGHGVPQNHAEAAKWYRMSVQQGNEDARTRLNELE